jgi:hypothetical protein
MPSTPRGRNAATTVAVVLAVLLAVLLALLWLRSSGAEPPSVPVGLPVETVPTAVAEPAGSTGLGQGGEAEAEGPSVAGAVERGGDDALRGLNRVEQRANRSGGERRPGGHARPHRRGNADRAGGDEDARAPRKRRARARRGTAGEAGGQDPPATAPAPEAGMGEAGGSAPTDASPAQQAPEFAIG